MAAWSTTIGVTELHAILTVSIKEVMLVGWVGWVGWVVVVVVVGALVWNKYLKLQQTQTEKLTYFLV